jgi:putative acetyltransferase
MMFAEATPADAAAIAAINRAAFGGEEEVEIIERLEADGLVVLSLVARYGPDIVGHILFSRLDVTLDGRPLRALALAPMAVRPDRQRQCVGSALIREALARLRKDGWQAVFVVGHQNYYPRFGFSAGLAKKFESPFDTDAFMALELIPDALSGSAGRVTYPPAFGL